ncbi:MAG: hypothetical protein HOB38_24025 [Deltaproteobacteria bacterium]|jgi:nucleotidyltransferase substrate binding protein (TIGR01987 family)|nr:hypothetical protein [Deltaproteobacteria bacterium]MBT6615183.1 hypothetical protein [Deltaproteobacteria bacterium]
MESRLDLRIQQYEDAVGNFGESLSIDLKGLSDKIIDSIKSGRAQKFEVCVELLWKTLKSYLWEVNGIDSKSPKTVVKEAYNQGSFSVQDYEHIIGMLDDRNKLSHIYEKEQFEAIYLRIINAYPVLIKVLEFLKQGIKPSK